MENEEKKIDKVEKKETPIYIDLRLMRNAVNNMKDSGSKYTMEDLLKLAFDKNIIIGDSEDAQKE